jgi:HlyD family secretion protein
MKRKWLIIVPIFIVIASLIVWQRRQPEAVVDVIHPRVATIRAYVEEQATTELPTTYLVAMPIAGWLERIDLREGDAVQKGQIAARLDTADLQDQVTQVQQQIARLETEIRKTSDNRLENNMLVQAEAIVKAMNETVEAAQRTMEASKAVAEFAKTEVDRLKGLRNTNAATDVEIRMAEMNWHRSEAENQRDALQLAALKTLAAVSYIGPKSILDYIDRKSFDKDALQRQIDEARSQLEIQKRNLTRATVESPIDGVILNRHETRHQYLPAGTPLLTLGRLEDMEVIAEVLTERAMRVSPGDSVEIYGEGIPSGAVTGTVSRIYPAGFKKISSLGVEQQRVNVAVQLAQRPARLGVNFRVNVRIFYDQAVDVPTLPRTALFRSTTGGWQVMVVRNSRTAIQPVKIGLMNDEDAQITEGVNTTDAVLARPSTDITPGLRVQTTSAQ